MDKITPKIAFFGLVTVIVAINGFLQGWLFLLQGDSTNLLWVVLSIVIIIALIRNIRMELNAQQQ